MTMRQEPRADGRGWLCLDLFCFCLACTLLVYWWDVLGYCTVLSSLVGILRALCASFTVLVHLVHLFTYGPCPHLMFSFFTKM